MSKSRADSCEIVYILSHQRRLSRESEPLLDQTLAGLTVSEGTVWIFLATWILQIPVVASMAEMASMAPTSGG